MTKADELVLHIGHGKTGTTTLQNTLVHAREALQQQGVLVPVVHRGMTNALVLGYALLGIRDADGNRQHWLGMDVPELQKVGQQAWDDIQNTVAQTAPKTVIVSSEMFFRPMRADTIRSANQAFSKIAQTSRIVAYLRAPDTHFMSAAQENLKHFLPICRPGRSHVRDTIRPLMRHWDGPVSLEVFDRKVMHDGDIVTDFLTRHLPDIDPASLERKYDTLNTSISAEAMAVLYDVWSGRYPWKGDRRTLAMQIIKADKRLGNPTKVKPRPGVAQTLINWAAPDLFWLRDERNITFPGIDYAAIDPDDIDDAVLRIGRIEDICDVNPDRKDAVLRRAIQRTRLPPIVRRRLAIETETVPLPNCTSPKVMPIPSNSASTPPATDNSLTKFRP